VVNQTGIVTIFSMASREKLSDNYQKSRGRWKAFSFLRDRRVSRGRGGSSIGLGSGGRLAMRRVHRVRSLAPKRRSGRGERLRALRLVLRLTMRDVQQASFAISKRLRNSEFLIPASRLHDFETRSVVPSIHRLYTLASIYRCEITELLGLYGVPQHVSKAPVQPALRG
jgi:hypothetical protein